MDFEWFSPTSSGYLGINGCSTLILTRMNGSARFLTVSPAHDVKDQFYMLATRMSMSDQSCPRVIRYVIYDQTVLNVKIEGRHCTG